ncbi:MAG: hypothetical protein AB7Q17_11315 [Phycisphaerae bacterium]
MRFNRRGAFAAFSLAAVLAASRAVHGQCLPAFSFPEYNVTVGGDANNVASAGDIDSDGHTDVVVGDPAASGGRGQVLVFSGRTGAVLASPVGGIDDAYGFSVAPIGDFNADSFDDVLVGAPGARGAQQTVVGRVVVLSGRFLSGAGGPDVLWSAEGPVANESFGWVVAAGGNLFGDGAPAVLVGAPAAGWQGASSGSVYALSGASAQVVYRLDGNQANSGFGRTVTAVGDADGDGRDDVLVGAAFAQRFDALDTNGYAQLFSGSTGGLLRTHTAPLCGGCFWAGGVGRTVSAIGDLDADGRADYALTTAGERAAVFSATGALLYESRVLGTGCGVFVSKAGDFNADGVPDLAAAARCEDPAGAVNAGSAFVISGRFIRTGGGDDFLWQFDGPAALAYLGVAVATAGDLNADGADDLLIGMQSAGGVAFAYLGGCGVEPPPFPVSCPSDPPASGGVPIAPPGFVLQTVSIDLPPTAWGLAVAPPEFGAFAGHVFAADVGCVDTLADGRVLRVDPVTGEVNTFAGPSAALGDPAHLTFGPAGSWGGALYTSSAQNPLGRNEGLISRVSAAGFVTAFGSPTGSRLFGGVGLTFSTADPFGARVYSGASGGLPHDALLSLSTAGGGAALFAEFPAPGLRAGQFTGLAFGAAANSWSDALYAAVSASPPGPVASGVYAFQVGGARTSIADATTSSLIEAPQEIEFGAGGAFEHALYVAERRGVVLRIAPGGAPVTWVSGLASAYGLAFDGARAFYFNDPLAGRLYRLLPTRPGDLNCDGAVNNFDIDAFVLAIADPPEYARAHPLCARENADCNADGRVNNFDIDAFVALLAAP